MRFDGTREVADTEGSPREDPVIVVSGLPRSGTSMMMKMLDAGGVPVLADGLRTADADNPRGYYEFERVKALRTGDDEWVREAPGRAVKVISELLKWLPGAHRYRVIFMRRDLGEIIVSQRRMLERRGKETGTEAEEERFAAIYARHLADMEQWLAQQPNMEVLYVGYRDVLEEPESELERVNRFLERDLDVAAMREVVDPGLYRARVPSADGST